MSSDQHQIVAFVPIYNGTYFHGLFKLASSLSDDSNFKFIFYFGRDYPNQESHVEILKNKYEFIISSSSRERALRGLRIRGLLTRWHAIDEIFTFIDISLNYLLLAVEIKTILRNKNISLCVFPADNRYSYPFIAKFARAERIPIIVIPQWFAGPKEIEQSLGHSAIYKPKSFGQKLVKFLSPKCLRDVSSQGSTNVMIPVRLSELFLSWMTRTIPPRPWILHSGYSDRIFVETFTTYEFARSLGFDQKQLVITGSPYLDEIDEAKFHSSPRIGILVAIAPDMFLSRQDAGLEFDSYEQYLVFICSALLSTGFQEATFSMHPSDSGQFDQLITDFGFEISKEPLHLLLTRADIFVATISATIQWAEYIKVPTINFDFYRYEYPDYLDYSCVIPVMKKKDFENSIDIARKQSQNRKIQLSERRMIPQVGETTSVDKIRFQIRSVLEGEEKNG